MGPAVQSLAEHPIRTVRQLFFFFFSFWVTGELSTLRQLMKVPNEPGLSPNNGLEHVPLSDQSMASNPRKGQAKCPGAKTTSHDGLPFDTCAFFRYMYV